ncbi:hypothetical protein Zmor_021418 [Zophobas morio]|uniref:Reverse transcriptase domain-containing protein n=1 Tax=Zophobas morio TaxID=2755281 RepID=A0AA38I7T7_9CUCU|nr:hypothetical protein Zmor_021418 [Zophobas morio]
MRNYRGMALVDVICKILATRINRRLKQHMEYQAGFRNNRSTVDKIFILKELQAVNYEQGITLYLLFIDFKKANNTINRKELLTAMQKLEIPNKMIRLTGMTIDNTRNRVTSNRILSQIFQVTTGLQGDLMSTTLFNLALEVIN